MENENEKLDLLDKFAALLLGVGLLVLLGTIPYLVLP